VVEKVERKGTKLVYMVTYSIYLLFIVTSGDRQSGQFTSSLTFGVVYKE